MRHPLWPRPPPDRARPAAPPWLRQRLVARGPAPAAWSLPSHGVFLISLAHVRTWNMRPAPCSRPHSPRPRPTRPLLYAPTSPFSLRARRARGPRPRPGPGARPPRRPPRPCERFLKEKKDNDSRQSHRGRQERVSHCVSAVARRSVGPPFCFSPGIFSGIGLREGGGMDRGNASPQGRVHVANQ